MNYDNCDGMTYTIKQGDTLYGISRKYDVPLAMILHANPYADVYRLNIGDTICIPVKNKKKCCNDKNSSSMNDKADRMENFRENQNVRVSENTGENSEIINHLKRLMHLEVLSVYHVFSTCMRIIRFGLHSLQSLVTA